MTLPLTSYIAHLNTINGRHREVVQDMTDRGFPCVISNDLLGVTGREYPHCSASVGRELGNARIMLVKDERLAFFFLFMNESQHNEIAAFELGLAIQTKATTVLIGPHPRSGIHLVEDKKIVLAYDYENFLSMRFPG